MNLIDSVVSGSADFQQVLIPAAAVPSGHTRPKGLLQVPSIQQLPKSF
jgi:hypothetical protein